MKRLSKISLLLGGLLLTACSSPKISDVKVQIVDNAPQNYKQVAKTEIEITTKSPINEDLLHQEFNDLKINYYDKNNNLVTSEQTKTIQEAVNQNKTNMTLVLNKGRGTNISYKAHLDKDKTESRTYNVPYVTEVSSKTKTEAELKDQAERNKENTVYDWEGVSSKTIDSIKIQYKQDYTDREYKYAYDFVSGKHKWKWVNVTRTRVDEHTYKYHDNKLELITQNQRTE